MVDLNKLIKITLHTLAKLAPNSITLTIVFVIIFVAGNIKTGAAVTPNSGETETIPVTYDVKTNTYITFIPMIARKVPSCKATSFGTMLIDTNQGDWIAPADVIIYANDELNLKGLAVTGSPSKTVRDEWFGRLQGWTRVFLRGTYDKLTPIHNTAVLFDMEDMYECIGYGPESTHQAGEEAWYPQTYVPLAEAVADKAGKCLVYGPAVEDYEKMSTPVGSEYLDEALLSGLITNIAPHVDIWMIQLAKYQRWTDWGHDDAGNSYSMDNFTEWVNWWVTQIKTANPHAEVWTQLGVGVFDPIEKVCKPPQQPGYLLKYRAALIEAGVDGIFVMPSQSCQESNDPQDHEYYLQSLYTFQQSLQLACGY